MNRREKIVGTWLLICTAGIFALILWGGYTRLSRSGLSIVEWKPIRGVIPPLSEKEWMEKFEKYKQFPEYRENPQKITLEQFKQIYWVEFLHRLFGRLVGLFFIIPLFWFWWKGWLTPYLVKQLLILLLLGMFQALWGWFMVKSGLVDKPRVSHYRLAGHLLIATFIYLQLFWIGLNLRFREKLLQSFSTESYNKFRRWSWGLLTFAVVTILAGALVAGLRAGEIANTFPLMNGKLIPDGLFYLKPFYINFFENQLTVQFQHRVLGISLWLLSLVFWWKMRGLELPKTVKFWVNLFPILTTLQMTLGIFTVLSSVALPLGVTHQGGAFIVLTTLGILVQFRAVPPMADEK